MGHGASRGSSTWLGPNTMNIENIPTPITDREEFPIFTPGADSTETTAVESSVARRLERENVKLRYALSELVAQCKTGDDISAWWRVAVDNAEAALTPSPNTRV